MLIKHPRCCAFCPGLKLVLSDLVVFIKQKRLEANVNSIAKALREVSVKIAHVIVNVVIYQLSRSCLQPLVCDRVDFVCVK